MKLLVVDDNEDARTYLKVMLTTHGYELITASDGQEGLELARQEKPDLVISDGMMPRIDGFEMCRRMKQDEELRTIPFIFYTGTYVDKRDKEVALSVGAERFLVKPLKPELLLRVVEEVISESVKSSKPIEPTETEVLTMQRDRLYRQLDSKVGLLEVEKKARYVSESRYRRLVESLEQGYFFYSRDTDGKFSYVSPTVRGVLGYNVGQFKTHYSEILTDNPLNEAIEASTAAAVQGDIHTPYELELNHVDGSKRWLEITEFSVRNEEGELVAIEGVAHDITQHKLAREAVLELASKNTLILESVGEGIIGIDRNGNHTFVNSAAVNALGWGSQELLGKRSHTLWHHSRPDGTPYLEHECPILEVLDSGVKQQGEDSFIRKDGSFFPVAFTATPIIKGGEVVGVVVGFMDISERKQQEERLHRSLEQTIKVVTSALEQRDPLTAGHQQRVADLATAIARRLKLSEQVIQGLYLGGIIHDIGKISIPAEILTKPGKLTDTEFSIIQTHVQKGWEILEDVDFPWPIRDMVMQHHERLDGSGYPNELRGDEIILEARILAVADVMEAIMSHRPYREALGVEAGVEELSKNRGGLYDPDVVDACVWLFTEDKFSWP